MSKENYRICIQIENVLHTLTVDDAIDLAESIMKTVDQAWKHDVQYQAKAEVDKIIKEALDG